MKKKILIPILAVIVLAAILIVPIPQGAYDDGGTEEFVALTYKIVRWNKLLDLESGGGVYHKTRIYTFADKDKSIGELWEMEKARMGKRHLSYTEEWLDKATAEVPEHTLFSDIVITEIYADCFFARPVIPMPFEIKLNGTLSDEWCVGDQIIVEYENVYYDPPTSRIEADMISVAISDFELDPYVTYKPVIYLYPEEPIDATVTLVTDGALTCTYPAYRDGWRVSAAPDGTLTDAAGQTYNYLYWEGETYAEYDFTSGFCVRGEDTAAFLEDALAKLGLNRREANEFIVYWLPQMQENPYNIIAFQTEAYTESARLTVTPEPDTVIRVFMAWKASDSPVFLDAQMLTAPERKGFAVIEWGGTEIYE